MGVDTLTLPESTSTSTIKCRFSFSPFRFVFFSFQIFVMPSLSFVHPFSLTKFQRPSQSCSKCCPSVLLLYDICQTFSGISSTFLAVDSQDVLYLSKHCLTSSSAFFFWYKTTSASSQLRTEQSCISAFVPLSTLVCFFNSAACCNSSSSHFSTFLDTLLPRRIPFSNV